MSILGKIMGAIFGTDAKAQAAPTPPASPEVRGPAATPGTGQAAGLGAAVASGPTSASAPAQAEAPAQASAAATTATPGKAADVDVAEVLDRAVADKGQKLNWRTSIVDLMKALDLDSSLAARKELASDLHYTGDTSDSATMNMWLHKALMKRLAENGGRVPDDLKS